MSSLAFEDIETIAVLGAGNMGHGIAEVAAFAGYTVHLRDIDEELVQEGYDQIAWSVEKLADSDRLSPKEADAAMDRIETYVALEAALADVDVVIGVVPEKMAIKTDVYADVSEHAPERAVFTTNTSTLSITEISEATDRPERFCGTHFFNPPVRMPLVEAIRGEHTSDETLDLAEELVDSFEKTPIRVCKDTPGFVVNRVLVPLLNEAAWIVHADDATIAEVDSTSKFDLGLPMGCFELSDQIGIDVILDVLDYMHETLGDGYAPCPLFKEQVDTEHYGKKTGQGFYDWESGGANIPTDAASDTIKSRLLGVAVNEVSKLVADDVAAPDEIDEAVALGAGFPQGPTAMTAEIGFEPLYDSLASLYADTDEERYAPTALLSEWADTGGPDA